MPLSPNLIDFIISVQSYESASHPRTPNLIEFIISVQIYAFTSHATYIKFD